MWQCKFNGRCFNEKNSTANQCTACHHIIIKGFKKAPESLLISVTEVQIHLIFYDTKSVDAKAEVLSAR